MICCAFPDWFAIIVFALMGLVLVGLGFLYVWIFRLLTPYRDVQPGESEKLRK